MRLGLLFGTTAGRPTLENIVSDAKRAETEGFDFYSMANIFSHDAIGALTVAGWETERIELLTAVVPTYPRHPMAIAQQALTAQAAAHGRFTLGIGLSHQHVIEEMFGYSYDRPALHMREYLSVLMPLLNGEPAQFEGEQYRVNGQLRVAGAERVPCLVAALASVMLRVAGEMADGTLLWMAGPKAIETHIAPRIRKAASAAGRPTPRIVCTLPIALVSDANAAREVANKTFENYGRLVNYRRVLDHEGAPNPGDVAIVGNEESLDEQLRHLEDLGVSEFGGAVFDAEPGAAERTREWLAERARAQRG